MIRSYYDDDNDDDNGNIIIKLSPPEKYICQRIQFYTRNIAKSQPITLYIYNNVQPPRTITLTIPGQHCTTSNPQQWITSIFKKTPHDLFVNWWREAQEHLICVCKDFYLAYLQRNYPLLIQDFNYKWITILDPSKNKTFNGRFKHDAVFIHDRYCCDVALSLLTRDHTWTTHEIIVGVMIQFNKKFIGEKSVLIPDVQLNSDIVMLTGQYKMFENFKNEYLQPSLVLYGDVQHVDVSDVVENIKMGAYTFSEI